MLSRFDGVVFVGDGPLFSIYAALNILLRENLASGSLKQWDMSSKQVEECKCDKQFSNSQCLAFRVGSSEEVYTYDGKASTRSPYVCSTCENPTILLDTISVTNLRDAV